MRLFLNAGFGDLLTVPVIQELMARGFAGIRQDMRDGPQAVLLCDEIAAAKAQAILLVGGGRMAMTPAQIAELARHVAILGMERELLEGDYPCAIEIGNEPDNAVAYPDHPEMFAEAVRASRDAVRDVAPHAPVISGGIKATSRKGLDYLARAVTAGIPDDCIIGYHTYRTTQEPEKPMPGFSNRDAEFARLRQIAGKRQIWCTETGWHTAPSSVPGGLFGWKKRKVQYTDAQVADFALREIRINSANGALGFVWFQLNDGEDPDKSEQAFGIRRLDGTWKPVADTLRTVGPTVA